MPHHLQEEHFFINSASTVYFAEPCES